MSLYACPFCREMFESGEATHCPVCGFALKEFEKLPPSIEAADQDGVPTAPETELLPLSYLGRGKGVLAALALLGLFLFWLPWISVSMPEIMALSGFDLARRQGWSWGAGVAWLVLVPTVLSRRSILQMRGARVAAAFLAAVPGTTVAILLSHPQQRTGLVPVRFVFEWPLYATLVVSVVAFAWAAFRLGGGMMDIHVRRGTSDGQTLH